MISNAAESSRAHASIAKPTYVHAHSFDAQLAVANGLKLLSSSVFSGPYRSFARKHTDRVDVLLAMHEAAFVLLKDGQTNEQDGITSKRSKPASARNNTHLQNGKLFAWSLISSGHASIRRKAQTANKQYPIHHACIRSQTQKHAPKPKCSMTELYCHAQKSFILLTSLSGAKGIQWLSHLHLD